MGKENCGCVLAVQEVARRYVTVPASTSTLAAPFPLCLSPHARSSPLTSTGLIAYHFTFDGARSAAPFISQTDSYQTSSTPPVRPLTNNCRFNDTLLTLFRSPESTVNSSTLFILLLILPKLSSNNYLYLGLLLMKSVLYVT